MLNLKISGLKSFTRNIAKLRNTFDSNLEKVVRQEAEDIATDARLLTPVDTGDLRGKTQTRIIHEQDGSISGEVYNSSDHAAYVEFGTGLQGMAAGIDIEGLNLTYTLEPWFVPVEWVTGTKKPTYDGKVKIVYGKDGQAFYMTNGQAPQPFLYPAMKQHEQEIAKKLGSAINMESITND